ncbi:MAG: gliding motility-associated ABC transporter ATP-binding subunit GldA [Flavobacterium sp.]|jgi:ABC-2 type transport system ATP-binding protein|uniref:gliding motility-associated ABC transporter ATP-binding subunit GldA n=1 Tax=Flavobacterium sp. TaxID=239 RepID=UPI0022C63904|nr:gliding motility-associated ABC transporter ATP-binding subunit GldA [Flavobacterium sp.]MCZ8168305.1 gliding motility-associated ABC transporter ATP-binding subunit GldA [Flavobacterium sp.]MCZ8298210.1 gliding motility-associated ABC transporter ATP-binding subunit GldA [Flavobacterium sp.]
MSIEVQAVSKYYGTQKALDSVSFSVQKGEIVGFLGPNGAGKSTLMKILTTYLNADEGSAAINGHDVVGQAKAVQRVVGYLPEHNPLYLDLYVREYLAFNADVYRIPKARIEEVITLTGLTPEAHKKIGQLSKGYRQRVGLATALLHDPEVLILDEPTTGLDPNQLVEIRNVIRQVGKNKTVFLSTHIMQEVEALCDRVIIINQGKIVTDKKLDKLVDEVTVQVLEVEFDQDVEANVLEALVGLTQVRKTKDRVWELTFQTEEDPRVQLFDFATAQGVRALQIVTKSKNLEQIFREKTTTKR